MTAPDPLFQQTGYSAVIGLEVHLQLQTHSKLLSACPADYHGAEPNTFTDPVSLGLPGTLPVLNAEALELALRFGLGLNCTVEGVTQFHRKHYFYPDSSKNFQLSQWDRPVAHGGFLDVEGGRVGITRAHLEEDAGKLMHPAYAPYSELDLNRAGTPLIEMVTEPDIKSGPHARAFLETVQAIARALGVSHASPEDGQMRCDVNISLHQPGEPWGTKVEVKNLNSFRSVERAITYEWQRQARRLAAGEAITQDTLGWDEGGGKTFLMRTKEGEADYRYMAEPDLPELHITSAWVADVRSRMPELPAQKLERYLAAGLRESDARAISMDVNLSRFFDAAMQGGLAPIQKVSNWLLSEVPGVLGEQALEDSALEPQHLAELVALIESGDLTGRAAKDLLPDMVLGQAPRALAETRGLLGQAGAGELEAAVDAAIAADPGTAAQVRGGNKKAINALFGAVMKATGGKANPGQVRELLTQRLEG
ncbi:Asp-tRNA(Asn)/Glu-tRNA(Gln) amidotransferase subunit GatB [Deinococcus radiophilus]|uniref:Aspartyl/glutamyl-tRNA(Asn/Gln) amidotransferase subunit B n=1 Tax=Deinococcus radiophilus TaxID=32062 RepID=A0A431VRM8_9DEIO|nr:Asp-tRNA(Asn)/Glu-tRNA(Gln) amidotransferase subunit GatB [Deinococcus radiophilus]RTR25799.1 Asp-tRNA(Asn)/Glu-tRNA(Gln) amidotransferase subunit GatB [Deinococcus radiophilus]UFA50844.1 Asp-tRNA(Asn)/Glu-tRNA(Gln) amidotransferase subunit GatB [Deinococcus radiophilus]